MHEQILVAASNRCDGLAVRITAPASECFLLMWTVRLGIVEFDRNRMEQALTKG